MATKLQTKPTATVPVVVRTRTRLAETTAADVTPEQQVIIDEQLQVIKTMARTTFIENKKLNAATSAYNAARKGLLEYLKKNNILQPFSVPTTNAEGDEITLTVKVEAPSADYISIPDLRKLVKDDATFFKIVSATKKSVTENVGSIIAKEATRTGTGTENVFVKPLTD